MSVEEKIADTARAINVQIESIASAMARRARNVVVLDDGTIYEIENHSYLEQLIEDNTHKLDDMLRYLDKLLKERDGRDGIGE